MKTISLVAFSFLVVSAWSQNDNFSMDVSQLRAETIHFDIIGSPYFDETYRLGHIYFKGEKLTFYFRFNPARSGGIEGPYNPTISSSKRLPPGARIWQ